MDTKKDDAEDLREIFAEASAGHKADLTAATAGITETMAALLDETLGERRRGYAPRGWIRTDAVRHQNSAAGLINRGLMVRALHPSTRYPILRLTVAGYAYALGRLSRA